MFPSFLGAAASPVDTFLLAHPKPTSGQVASLLSAFPADQRAGIAQDLISKGVEASTISSALTWLEAKSSIKAAWPTIGGVLALTSAAASAYHGYRRNQSIGWGVWWFLMGSIFPVVTPVFAVAQGFGKRKGS